MQNEAVYAFNVLGWKHYSVAMAVADCRPKKRGVSLRNALVVERRQKICVATELVHSLLRYMGDFKVRASHDMSLIVMGYREYLK